MYNRRLETSETMAHIEPFRALRYDPTRVSIPQVVTQPYDKITPEMQNGYYAASPHNLVRVILGKEHAGDHTGESKYSRAAQSFQEWRRQGIFLQDAQPSLYLYVQRFAVPGGTAELERRGIIALGRIEDYTAGVVFRHEQTLAKPKADRLELLRATRAHFGQLFMLYSDPAAEIDGLLAPSGNPDLETQDEYGVSHRVWKISDPGLVNLVRGKMRDKKLVIADGHHRYETALNYRNERRATAGLALSASVPREKVSDQHPSLSADPAAAPYELVMMTLVNMDSPGMVILPTHRVVHGLPAFSSAAFRDGAKVFFSVEEVDASVDAARAKVILREAGRVSTRHIGGRSRPRLSSGPAESGGRRFLRGLVAPPAGAGRSAIAQVFAGKGAGNFGRSGTRADQRAVHTRHRRGHGPGTKRRGQCGVSDESCTHGSSARYCLCRRSAAAEVNRFLSQAAYRLDDLCAGVGEGRSAPPPV